MLISFAEIYIMCWYCLQKYMKIRWYHLQKYKKYIDIVCRNIRNVLISFAENKEYVDIVCRNIIKKFIRNICITILHDSKEVYQKYTCYYTYSKDVYQKYTLSTIANMTNNKGCTNFVDIKTDIGHFRLRKTVECSFYQSLCEVRCPPAKKKHNTTLYKDIATMLDTLSTLLGKMCAPTLEERTG